jgi:hypothetical protein
MAGIVLVTAGACTSNSTASGGNGGNNGPAVNGNDPNSIISAVVSNGSQIKSFHIKIAATGTIKSAALADTGTSALSGDLKLDGATIEGDVDVTNAATHLTFTLPAVPVSADMSVPISGDIIVVKGIAYYKVVLTGATGTKYTKLDLSSSLGSITALSSSLPVAGKSASASAMTPSALQSELAQVGVTSKVVGVDNIGGQDAYHIAFTLPLSTINAGLASQTTSSSMKIDTLGLDVWVYKNNNRPAKAELKEGSTTLGDIDLTVTVTDYDKSVTVAAPAASDITP